MGKDAVYLRPLQVPSMGRRSNDMNENKILSSLSLEFFFRWKRRRHISELIAFLLLMTIYYFMLWTQFDIKNAYTVNVSLQNILPQDNNNNALTSFSSTDQIYTWLQTSVINSIWVDPTCGNGVCDSPLEIPGGIYRARGCSVDCGDSRKVYIYVALFGDSATRYLTDTSSWNLSMNWIALEEYIEKIGANDDDDDVQFPSAQNGTINGTKSDFIQIGDVVQFNLTFYLNQGPYVKWYIDVPFQNSNAFINITIAPKIFRIFGGPEGSAYANNTLNAFWIWKKSNNDNNSNEYSCMMDNRKYDYFANGSISCMTGFSNSNLKWPYTNFWSIPTYTYTCVGKSQSVLTVNVINPVKMYANLLSNIPRTVGASTKQSNRAVMGVLVTLSRKLYSIKQCGDYTHAFNFTSQEFYHKYGNRFGKISPWCEHEKITNTDPYGHNPVFTSTSSLYNSSLNASDYYSSDQMIDGLPYGFIDLIDAGDGQGRSFFVLFDLALKKSNALKLLQYMVDGAFIDSNAHLMTVKILSFNGIYSQFSLSKIKILFSDSGSLSIQNEINFLPVYSQKASRYLFHLFWILISLLLLIEVIKFISLVKKNKIFKYFYLNLIEVLTNSLMIINGIIWIIIQKRIHHFYPLPRYDVYNDLSLHDPNFLKLSNEYYDDKKAYLKMNEQYVYFNHTLNLKYVYLSLTCMNSIFIVIRAIKLFDFDTQFGIISSTIRNISSNLFAILLLWVIITIGYAVTGVLSFGDQMQGFSELGRAFNSLGEIIFGNTDVNTSFFQLYPNFWHGLPAHIFFWTYIIISFVILLNFVIAVILDAFTELKSKIDEKHRMKKNSWRNEALLIFKKWKHKKSHYYLYLILNSYSERKSRIKKEKVSKYFGFLNQIFSLSFFSSKKSGLNSKKNKNFSFVKKNNINNSYENNNNNNNSFIDGSIDVDGIQFVDRSSQKSDDFSEGTSSLFPSSLPSSLTCHSIFRNKLLCVNGVEIDNHYLFSILKHKLEQELRSQLNEEEVIDLFKYVLKCYGVNTILMEESKDEEEKEGRGRRKNLEKHAYEKDALENTKKNNDAFKEMDGVGKDTGRKKDEENEVVMDGEEGKRRYEEKEECMKERIDLDEMMRDGDSKSVHMMLHSICSELKFLRSEIQRVSSSK